MRKLLGIGLSMLALLGIVWLGSTRSSAVMETTQENPEPKFYPVATQPQATKPIPTRQPQPYGGVIAKRLICYDGPFLEDAAEEEMIGVAALELCNTGDLTVEYVQAVVCQPDRQLLFEATYVPAGGSVVVLEKDAQLYDTDVITDFYCTTVICMEPESWEESVDVQTDGYCALKVTNLTEKSISCVRVFYKQYFEEEGFYLGGITYSVVLPDLPAGKSTTVSPYHFAAQYCRVVAVVVEP